MFSCYGHFTLLSGLICCLAEKNVYFYIGVKADLFCMFINRIGMFFIKGGKKNIE